jgi:hypothetical protein
LIDFRDAKLYSPIEAALPDRAAMPHRSAQNQSMKIPKYINIDPQGISPFVLRKRMRAFVDQSPSLQWRVEDTGIVVTNTDGSTTQLHPRQGIQAANEFHTVHERKGRLVVFVLSSESIYRACQSFAFSENIVVGHELDWDDTTVQIDLAEHAEGGKASPATS